MDKNKIHGFMDQLNLFFIGTVNCLYNLHWCYFKLIKKYKG